MYKDFVCFKWCNNCEKYFENKITASVYSWVLGVSLNHYLRTFKGYLQCFKIGIYRSIITILSASMLFRVLFISNMNISCAKCCSLLLHYPNRYLSSQRLYKCPLYLRVFLAEWYYLNVRCLLRHKHGMLYASLLRTKTMVSCWPWIGMHQAGVCGDAPMHLVKQTLKAHIPIGMNSIRKVSILRGSGANLQ